MTKIFRILILINVTLFSSNQLTFSRIVGLSVLSKKINFSSILVRPSKLLQNNFKSFSTHKCACLYNLVKFDENIISDDAHRWLGIDNSVFFREKILRLIDLAQQEIENIDKYISEGYLEHTSYISKTDELQFQNCIQSWRARKKFYEKALEILDESDNERLISEGELDELTE